MIPSRPTTPLLRLAGPVLLLAAAVLPWAPAARVAVVGAVVAFGALVLGVRRVARHRASVTLALVVTLLAGTATALAPDLWWCWAVLGSGVVGALGSLAWSRQVSWLEPTLAAGGFAVAAADRDLLPLGAVLLAAALMQPPAPVASSHDREDQPV